MITPADLLREANVVKHAHAADLMRRAAEAWQEDRNTLRAAMDILSAQPETKAGQSLIEAIKTIIAERERLAKALVYAAVDCENISARADEWEQIYRQAVQFAMVLERENEQLRARAGLAQEG